MVGSAEGQSEAAPRSTPAKTAARPPQRIKFLLLNVVNIWCQTRAELARFRLTSISPQQQYNFAKRSYAARSLNKGIVCDGALVLPLGLQSSKGCNVRLKARSCSPYNVLSVAQAGSVPIR